MSAIHGLLAEIRFEMLKVIILEAFLDATILFLTLFLLLALFGIGLLPPLILALLFLAGDIAWRSRRISLRFIEERNPGLREMLRTAADNKEDEGLMAHALFAEVIERMREVSGGSFLDFKRTGTKIGAVFVVSALLVALAFFNVNIQKFENPLAGLGGRLGDGFSDLFSGEQVAGANLSDEDAELYGDPRMARLGQEELDVTIRQSLNRIDFTQVGEADPSEAGLEEYPVEVGAEASEAYTAGLEDINDRKTAADYSQEVRR